MKRSRDEYFANEKKRRRTDDIGDEMHIDMLDSNTFTPALSLSCVQDDSAFQEIVREVAIIEGWDERNWQFVDSSLRDKFFQYLHDLRHKQFNLQELPQLNELLDYLNSSVIAYRISLDKRTLELERLSLTRFPASLLVAPYYSEYWMTLESLILSDNRLVTLPKEIGTLRNLQYLYLGRNMLSAIPSEVAQLSELRVLDVQSNRLEYIFDEIGYLRKLEYLGIANNAIRTVPDLSSLIHLKAFEAAYNHLRELPPGLVTLEELGYVDIKFNKLNENALSNLSENFEPEWHDEMISSQSESSSQDYGRNRFF